MLVNAGWADDVGVIEGVAGGGLTIFLYFAVPVLVVTFIAWAVIAWYASDDRQLAAGWVAALAIGVLFGFSLTGGSPMVLAQAACGQIGAWLLARLALRTRATDAPGT